MSAIFPEKFLDRYKKILSKKEFEKFLFYSQKPLRKSIRINSLKISVEEFKKISEKNNWKLLEIPWSKNGFWIDRENREIPLGKNLLHLLGAFFIQESSSMLPVEILFWNSTIRKNEKILDLCAAPGAKTTQIAEKISNNGIIFANEFSASRIKKLTFNLQRCNVQNAAILHKNGEKISQFFPQFFDKILLDVPCTGEGTIRKDFSALENWSEKKIQTAAKLQKKLLQSAFAALKNNGEIVYSTCTLSPEENEEIIADFLEKNPSAELVDLSKFLPNCFGISQFGKKNFSHICKKVLRIWPQNFDSEGFFVAKIKKKFTNKNTFFGKTKNKFIKNKFRKISLRKFKILQKFFLENFDFDFNPWSENFFEIGNEKIFLLPEKNENNFIYCDRAGILVAKIFGNQIRLGNEFGFFFEKFGDKNNLRILKISQKIVKKFLEGENLNKKNFKNLPSSGEILVFWEKYFLGNAKILGEKIKNNLPRKFIQK